MSNRFILKLLVLLPLILLVEKASAVSPYSSPHAAEDKVKAIVLNQLASTDLKVDMTPASQICGSSTFGFLVTVSVLKLEKVQAANGTVAAQPNYQIIKSYFVDRSGTVIDREFCPE